MVTLGEKRAQFDAGIAKLTADFCSNWQGRCLLWVMRRFGWPSDEMNKQGRDLADSSM